MSIKNKQIKQQLTNSKRKTNHNKNNTPHFKKILILAFSKIFWQKKQKMKLKFTRFQRVCSEKKKKVQHNRRKKNLFNRNPIEKQHKRLLLWIPVKDAAVE
jgi:hypothetical protein